MMCTWLTKCATAISAITLNSRAFLLSVPASLAGRSKELLVDDIDAQSPYA